MYARRQICAKTWNISISQKIPKQPVRSIFAYDRYCRRKRHQEDQICNGSASDRWHSDCKYPGNYSDTSVFILWHTEGVNITYDIH